MNFLSSLLLALSSATVVLAQDNTYADGLLAALRSSNLSQLADIVGNNTGLVSALQTGNKTVLAPTNEAFAALGNNVPSGEDLLNIIRYHVINSTLVQDDDNGPRNQSDSDSEFDVIIRSTLLTENVNLPGDRSQVIVIGEFDGNDTFYVQEAGRNVSFASENDGPQYQNLRVQPINQVLTPPGNLTTVAGQLGLSQLATLLGNANLVETLSNVQGLTIFAPENSALQSAQEAFAAASSEEQTNVLSNHVLMNQVVYSTQLPEDDDANDNVGRITNATSASGNPLSFTKNDTGLFVNSGSVSARIVRSDNLYNGGVIHIINNVLLNTTANQGAADEAASSASAAGASPTGNTGVDSGTNNNANNNNNANDDNSSSALVWSSAVAALSFVGGLALLV